jgi:hypothetical protein
MTERLASPNYASRTGSTMKVWIDQYLCTDVAPPIEIAECSLRGTLIRAGDDLDGARAEGRLNEPNTVA